MILAVLPYGVLKVCWLLGHPIGIPATSPALDFVVPNLITLGMDVVAVVLAFAFVADWGRRLPAWLLLVPGWVGVGLLAPTVAIVAAGFTHGLLTEGRPVVMRDGLVEGWTYTVVYASFAVQGVLLTLGFGVYAGRRWPDLFGRVLPRQEPVGRFLAIAGAVGASAVGATRLFEAIAAPQGWRVSAWTFANRFSEAAEGAMALAAAIGVLAIAGVRLHGREAVAVILTFVGSGSLFAWGLLRTFSLTARAPLSELITRQSAILDFAATITGLTIGLTALFLLTAKSRAGDQPCLHSGQVERRR
ncbi:hypothetical protein [Kribbella sp. CA-294648]|uniref:hypothetical protein n=1 Tax=Kribbella sp. CA-294648 TaxID=3239948 RepID=UPI003D8A82FC